MISRTITLSALAASGFAAVAFAQQTQGERPLRIATPPTSAIIASWKQTPNKAAQNMISKYGEPDEVTANRLVWHSTGPWKRTLLVNEEVEHHFPKPHKDALEQFIDYRVPPDKVDDLANYDGSVIVDRTKGELSARCDQEPANFLAINLANDIMVNKRSWQQARQFYASTMKNMMAGKLDAEQKRYTSGFVFTPPKGNTGYVDVPLIK